MKKAIVIIIVIAVLALIIYRISTYQKAQTAQSIADIQKQQGVPVEVLRVEKDTLVYSRYFSGTAEGYSQTDAIAHLMEKVSEVSVAVGDQVSKGDVLVVLDKTNPQAQYRQAKLAYDNAEKEFERMDALFKQGAVSRQMYDQVTLARDIAKTNFSNSRELVEITAPIDGIVTDVMRKSGEIVSPGDAVAAISRTDRIKCELWVGDADRQRIRKGQPALFIASTYNPNFNTNNSLNGRVAEVALSADRDSHLYKIIVEADNPSGILRPGQLVSVRVIIESVPNVLLIPKDAVIYKDGKPYIFKVDADVANLTPITLGRENKDHVELLSGLSVGDTIVVYGMNRLKSGDKIKIVSPSVEVENVSQ